MPEAITPSGGKTGIENGAIQALQSRLRGELIRPDSAGYHEARRVWNAMIDRRPALIVCCAGTADVIAAVNFAPA